MYGVHMYMYTYHACHLAWTRARRRYPYAYSVLRTHGKLHRYDPIFFFLVNYLLNANVSVTTAAHVLAIGEILVVLYPYIITLRMQYGLLTESLIAAWMVMVRPALLPSHPRSLASHLAY